MGARVNSGSIGKNRNKKTDTHPDLSGSIDVEGKDFWISGWMKVTDGEKWISLSVKPKEAKPVQQQRPPTVAEMEDDLPF